MSAPTITGNSGSYVLEWPEAGVKATATRFKETDSGCSCEVRFTATAAAHPHLHQARLNLLNTSARRTLAKTLEDAFPLDQWEAIVEQLSCLALGEWREGEPVLYLSSTDEVQPRRYLVEPLVPEGQPSIVFGPGGIGKSTLCLYLASAVASGIVPDSLEWKAQNTGEVLYLDYEGDPDEQRRRLRGIAAGLGVEVGVHYKRLGTPIPKCLDRLLELRTEIDPALVVVDSLALAAGGDNVSADCATELYAALRQLNTTVLIVAHPPKNAEKKSVYGSAFYEYLARNIWEARGYVNSGGDGVTLALHNTKANYGRKQRPTGVELVWGEDCITAATVETRSIPEEVEKMSLTERILALLPDTGPMTAGDLAGAVGSTPDTVGRTLRRLADKKRVVKLDGNRYGAVAFREQLRQAYQERDGEVPF